MTGVDYAGIIVRNVFGICSTRERILLLLYSARCEVPGTSTSTRYQGLPVGDFDHTVISHSARGSANPLTMARYM